MHSRTAKLVLLAVLLIAASRGIAHAANSAMTTIRVKDMHCESCAKKIRSKLFTVAGVVNVQTNVKANVATVTPQRDRQPSPRAMWEAVEQAGFQVMQLEGPSGTFSSKPQR
jgi:copper chaperone CopZ